MGFVDFRQYPLWTNLAVFAAVAVSVWLAGVRLTRYVDAIAERTGLGRSFAGVLLLGGITSLPEIVTIGTAAAIGTPHSPSTASSTASLFGLYRFR